MDIVLSYDADELYTEDIVNKGMVRFELQSTVDLDMIADAMRQQNGYIPFFDDSEAEIWDNGWYEFYVWVDVFKREIYSLVFVVEGNNADEDICPDNGHLYEVEDIDRANVMKQLIVELRKRHTSLDEIEKEVREYEDEN